MNKKMLINFIFIFSLLLIILLWYKKVPQNPILKTQLQTTAKENMTLTHWKGKIVLVSYFQSWCGDCRRELPEISTLQNAVGGSTALHIILISDEDWDKINVIKNIANNPEITFLQSQEDLKSIGIRRFPTTYLLDKNGTEIKAAENIYWNTPENIQLIKKLNQ